MRSTITFIAIIIAFNVTAQSKFGVNGGIQSTSLHYEDEVKNRFEDARIGFRVGAVYEVAFAEDWGFHTELDYSLAGTQHLDMHYLSVPVLLFYSPVDKLKVHLGPEINLLLGTNSDYKPFGKNFNRIDPGVTFAIEFLASKRIGISVRNYFGLRFNTKLDASDFNGYQPIPGDDPPIIPDDYELKMNRNNIFQVGISYYFNSSLNKIQ